jgi:hypothetical protein
MSTEYQKPNVKELQKFGLIFGVFFILVIGILIPVLGKGLSAMFSELALWPRWPWFIGGFVMVWSVIHPASLYLVHRPWMKFADIAAWVNTRIIMLILFYLLILPIGFIMRLFGYDPMRRKIDRQLQTYRNVCEPQDRDHMRHPY